MHVRAVQARVLDRSLLQLACVSSVLRHLATALLLLTAVCMVHGLHLYVRVWVVSL